MTLALLSAGISTAGSIGSGMLSNKPKETGTQKQRRELIDELLASIKGDGQFSDLFKMDEDAFQKSFIDPSKARFKNQMAPQIQQSFIAGGQQRGTGLDDTLTRAGVDMDQLLNEQFMNFQQGAMNRQSNALGGILGAGEGVQPGLSTGEKFRSGAAGYLSGSDFKESLKDIRKGFAS